MAHKQTRRSISISGLTYDRLKAHCLEKGCSMSSVVETLLKDSLPETGLKSSTNRMEQIRAAAEKTNSRSSSPTEGSHIFTF